MNSRLRAVLLAVVVGVVLADSAIVTLALPAILRELRTDVGDVAWVLIAFNAVLALAAVPAARLCVRGDAGRATAVGIGVFAAASGGCALAGTPGVLVAARVVQALGGALVIVGCLQLLADRPDGVRRWAAAGVTGAAVGPVAGGLLTSAISWQSIFFLQTPVLLLGVPAALRTRRSAAAPPARASGVSLGSGPRSDASSSTGGTVGRGGGGRVDTVAAGRPALAPNLALALLSAALTAALFLLVLLLVEAWRRSPAVAALTVTVVPVAALLAGPLARAARAGVRAEAAAGAVLTAGGLAGLALLPAAELGWTVAPQVLIGLGLGLTVDALTDAAVRGRVPLAVHGGWTIAARHAGIVVGLAILTPIFTHDLQAAQPRAEEVIARLVLDAPLAPQTKLDVADGLSRRLGAERGRVPDLDPAFAAIRLTPLGELELLQLHARLDDQLERAATEAFRTAFLVAALLALLALVPLAVAGRPRRPRGATTEPGGQGPITARESRGRRSAARPALALTTAGVLAVTVLGVQRAQGGGDFVPLGPRNPCAMRAAPTPPATLEGVAERVVLAGLDDTACATHVSRERLVLGIADADPDALRAGLRRAAASTPLPKVSALLPEILDASGLPGIAQDAIERLPDGLVDDLLPTNGVLVRAVDGLDPAVLEGRVDEDDLRDTILSAARAEIEAQLKAKLPGPLQDLLG